MIEARTGADRRAHLEGGLVAVTCGHCGAGVRVKKSSPQQTSVQWNRRAVRECAEFAEKVAAGGSTALIATCAKLRDSIERAASDGRLAPP